MSFLVGGKGRYKPILSPASTIALLLAVLAAALLTYALTTDVRYHVLYETIAEGALPGGDRYWVGSERLGHKQRLCFWNSDGRKLHDVSAYRWYIHYDNPTNFGVGFSGDKTPELDAVMESIDGIMKSQPN